VNETSAVTAIDDVMDRYFTMWNEVDPTARQAVIAATWSPEASYIDPLFDAAGYEALAAMVAAVHERFPGHRFRLAGAIDAHHARARWDWELAGPAGGVPVAAGVDFAMLAPDGRLRAVTGFFAQSAGT
jgi:hypothetical protein